MSNTSVIQKLTSSALAHVAPEELPLLPRYDPTASKPMSGARGPQGIGFESSIIVLLPFVYAFFTKFMEKIAANVADDIYSLFKGDRQLNEEQLAELKAQVCEELEIAGLQPENIEEVANAIIISISENRSSLK